MPLLVLLAHPRHQDHVWHVAAMMSTNVNCLPRSTSSCQSLAIANRLVDLFGGWGLSPVLLKLSIWIYICLKWIAAPFKNFFNFFASLVMRKRHNSGRKADESPSQCLPYQLPISLLSSNLWCPPHSWFAPEWLLCSHRPRCSALGHFKKIIRVKSCLCACTLGMLLVPETTLSTSVCNLPFVSLLLFDVNLPLTLDWQQVDSISSTEHKMDFIFTIIAWM